MRGYRAWIKEEKWMGLVINLYLMNEHAEVLTDFDPKSSCVGKTRDFDFKDIVLMQDTGLKDKNGVKIWENDIVSSPHFRDEAGRSYALEHIVKWSTKRHGWFLLNKSTMDDSDGSIMLFVARNGNIEVTGNIFENPEPMENK